MNVIYEVKEHIAVITLNRPEALNALSREALGDLDEAAGRARADEDVYVLVITGAGKAFAAGADIAEMKDFSRHEAQEFSEYGNEVFFRIEMSPKPVVAAVNGYALGGGMELCMACDIRIAAGRAKFGQPEVSLGVTPGFGGTQRLPRIVGYSKAKELIFTGRTIDADEALQIGLVDKTVPDGELMSAALELAGEIAKNAQIAVRHAKAAIEDAGRQRDIRMGVEYETRVFAHCFVTEDQKDAMTAFVSGTRVSSFKNK